ncbi:MAG: OmpA family protein [Deltaproteobacteria bacterium]|nr:OmpA family protein [Deltaproteobacteria bacterium]
MGLKTFPSVRKRKETKSDGYWLSISDLMAGVLIIFILFFVLKINYEVRLQHLFENLYDMREKIVTEMKRAFHSFEAVEIDENGTIRFFIDYTKDESQWFETGQAELTDTAKNLLQRFIPVYARLLYHYREDIDKVIIEGHTDSQSFRGVSTEIDNYLRNLNLSQARAYNVSTYIYKNVQMEPEVLEFLKKKMTANGRSYSDLIVEDGAENQNKSRRVEFKFRLAIEKRYEDFKQAAQ